MRESAIRVLVVDDEPGIVNLVKSYLAAEGFEVLTAADGTTALQSARAFNPDLIILDVMLPGMDGIEVLANLRRESNTYVIMLTSRSEETDKVIGLSVGADDYVTKPFSPRELTARVKAALRRMQGQSSGDPQQLAFPGLRIDLSARQVWANDVLVDLTTIEFDLLAALAQNRGRVLSREQLLEKVWGYDYYGDTRVVDVHIGHVRQKIGGEDLIATVRGVGYRFEDRKPR